MMPLVIGEESWIRKLLVTIPPIMHAEMIANLNQFDTHLDSTTTSRSSSSFSLGWDGLDAFFTRATQWFHQDKGSSAGTNSDASLPSQTTAESLNLTGAAADDIHKPSVGIGSQFSDAQNQELRCSLQLPRPLHTVLDPTYHVGSETQCSAIQLHGQHLKPDSSGDSPTSPTLLNLNSWVALIRYIIEECKDASFVSDVEEVKTKENSIDRRSDSESEFSLDICDGGATTLEGFQTPSPQVRGLATQIDPLDTPDFLLSPAASTQKPASGPQQTSGEDSCPSAENQDRANYRARNKGKQARKHGNSDSEDGNSQGNHRGNPKIKLSKMSPSNEGEMYACHYRKAYPTMFGQITGEWPQYKTCRNAFQDTREIEQHFKEVHHYSDYECCRCSRRFQNVKGRDDHLRDDSQRCETIPNSVVESEMWLTDRSERKARLKKIGKKSPKTLVKERWMQIWDAIFHPIPRPDSPYWESSSQQQELYQRTREIILQGDMGQDLAQIQPDGPFYESMTPIERTNTVMRRTWSLIEEGRLDYNQVMTMPRRSPSIAIDVSVATPSAIDALTPSSGSYGFPTQSEMDRGTPMSFGTAEDSATNQQTPFSHSPQPQQYDFNLGDTGPTRQPLFGSHLEPRMPGNWPNDVSFINHSEPGQSHYRPLQQYQPNQRRLLSSHRQQQRYRYQPPQS